MAQGNKTNQPKKYKDGRKRWLESSRKIYMREYYQKNKEKLNKKSTERSRERYRNDANFRKERLDHRKRWGIKNENYLCRYRRENKLCTNGTQMLVRKRPYLGVCELCGNVMKRLHWHHWDNEHPEFGLWLCFLCHDTVEANEQFGIEVPFYEQLKKIVMELN